ncbi:MAG: DNA repair protein RecN [Betaproteobacteria bacterium]|nr:DNA repair protein RecN [Betaproteobacteria bacterium]
MMLRRLSIRDFVIVTSLELEFHRGFSVLTGETGAGKSILIDALQLALGQRADALVVREGATRADISAEFDCPHTLQPWLAEAGLEPEDEVLLLRRSIDAGGKSRAWINGHSATAAQLKQVADHVLDIHGQHAWQSLTRPASVRALIDAVAGVDTRAVQAAWQAWRHAREALEKARTQADALAREREGLAWQIGELRKLSPVEGQWRELCDEHARLSNGHSLIEAAQASAQALEGDGDSVLRGLHAALQHLHQVQRHDARLPPIADTLEQAQSLIEDATHSLRSYLGRTELDPSRLQELDERMSAWMGLARRLRRQPEELPALLLQWEQELQHLDQSIDLESLQARCEAALAGYERAAEAASQARGRAAPRLAQQVSQAMQQLGMAGGRFEVALLPEPDPQSWGRESVELRVAGHEGSEPRPLAKVASGGELSRLALAIAVTTAQDDPQGAATLIFDEIDAGVGGSVADTVGRLMKQLGGQRQVLSVTHLAQVASCADHHFVVSKLAQGGQTSSRVLLVDGEARVGELARMLGGERLSTSVAHAQSLLEHGRSSTTP